MVSPTTTNKTIDSGQKNHRNRKETSSSSSTQFDPGNLVQNRQKNEDLKIRMDAQDSMDEDAHNNAGTSIDIDNEQEAKKRYLTIKLELEPEEKVDDEECSAMALEVTEKLLKAWDKDEMIQDAYDLDGRMLEKKYSELDSWAIIPRIVKKKKCTTIETIIQVKTKASACGLHKNQKEYCDQNNVSISGKRTGLEFTKKVGFIAGTHVKLASVDYHVDEIIDTMELDGKSIDIKKRFTYERNSRSKVLSVCAVNEEADQIDEKLLKLESPRYKYVSHKKMTSEERLAAMHHNDVKNIKAKYETLCDMNLKEEVWDTKSSRYVTLESMLMTLKHENHPLFLAAEQGAGKFKNNVNVVLNPRVKNQAKCWLSQECKFLTLKNIKDMKTSVIEQVL